MFGRKADIRTSGLRERERLDGLCQSLRRLPERLPEPWEPPLCRFGRGPRFPGDVRGGSTPALASVKPVLWMSVM